MMPCFVNAKWFVHIHLSAILEAKILASLLPVLPNAMTVIYIEAAATRWVDSTVPQIPPGLLVH